MYDAYIIENISDTFRREFVKKQEAALLKWLGVETMDQAIEKIEDLRCQGLTVEIGSDPSKYYVTGGGPDFKYHAEWTIRFKIVSIKETANAVSRNSPRSGKRGSSTPIT